MKPVSISTSSLKTYSDQISMRKKLEELILTDLELSELERLTLGIGRELSSVIETVVRSITAEDISLASIQERVERALSMNTLESKLWLIAKETFTEISSKEDNEIQKEVLNWCIENNHLSSIFIEVANQQLTNQLYRTLYNKDSDSYIYLTSVLQEFRNNIWNDIETKLNKMN